MATIRGTNLRNILNGTGASDTILGLGGNDDLFGKAGNDILDGGTGADRMTGGLGNDTYLVDNAGDKAIELGGQGSDIVKSKVTFTLGVNVENLTLTGTAAIKGTGNTLANSITGNASANILDGRTGADTMKGGLGNDTYIVDRVTDKVIEGANQGADTVKSSVTWTLGANVENLTLTGTAAVNGMGNALSNSITGNGANNLIRGGANVDTMTGGAGVDTFTWADGDTGVGAGNRDIITDFVSGVDKIDLSAIDAITYASTSPIQTAGDQAFGVFPGTGAFWVIAGGPQNFAQVRYQFDAGLNATIVQVNVQTIAPTFLPGTGYSNNDLVVDYEIQLSGNIALQLSDFTM